MKLIKKGLENEFIFGSPPGFTKAAVCSQSLTAKPVTSQFFLYFAQIQPCADFQPLHRSAGT